MFLLRCDISFLSHKFTALQVEMRTQLKINLEQKQYFFNKSDFSLFTRDIVNFSMSLVTR
jgi:hypothetical protein